MQVLLSPGPKGPPSPNRGILRPMDTGNSNAGSSYSRRGLSGFPTSRPVSVASTSSGRNVGALITQFTGNSNASSTSSVSMTFPDMSPPSPIKTHFTGMQRSASPVRRQFTGTSAGVSSRSVSPVKNQFTGNGGAGPLSPQFTGSGLPVTHARPMSVLGMSRSISPVKVHGTETMSPLVPQVTGGGLPVTRPRPKSVMGNRFAGTSHRGIELVRQMTGSSSGVI